MRLALDDLAVPDWEGWDLLDAQRVASLTIAAQAAGRFDEPVEAARLGKRHLVLDGRHRLAAARALGWTEIDAVVRPAASEADAVALAALLHGERVPKAAARGLAERLARAEPDDAGARFDPRRKRLLRELLAFLHDKKRVQDARLAQLFDLGDADTAQRARLDTRGLPRVEPAPLREMPVEVQLGVRELVLEHLLVREEVEHLFPLTDRERAHLAAERALRELAGEASERVKLKGARWGPDFRSGAPASLVVRATLPDGSAREIDLAEIPGLDRHTVGIIRKAFLGGA